MSGLIIKLPGVTFSGSLPKLYRDAIINPGSMFCFDFLDTYCNPNSIGNLANGLTLNNLVPGAPVATIVNSGASNVAMASNGIVMNGTAYGAIDFGTTYDLSSLNSAFLVTVWFKTSISQNASNPAVMSLANGAGTTNQYSIDTGAAPGRASIELGCGASLSYTAVPPTTLQQIGIFWTPGSMSFFRNGVLISTTPALSTLNVATGMHEGIGIASNIGVQFGQFNGTVYRAWKENLSVSAAASGLSASAQALAQIQADYAANSSRFA